MAARMFHVTRSGSAYDKGEVDAFLDIAQDDLERRIHRRQAGDGGGSALRVRLDSADVADVKFKNVPRFQQGYAENEVDDFLDIVEAAIRALDVQLTSSGVVVEKEPV